MPVRTSRSDQPVRPTRPVISPSRGPGPNRAPMYSAVATALSRMPPVASAIRPAIASTCGTSASAVSTATPMTTTLLTVPSPGRWRSGIQQRSTSPPTTTVTVPSDHPSRWDRPWCSTSHGMLPSADRIISAIEAP